MPPEAATADRPAATSICDTGSREEVAARVDASLVASLAEPQPAGHDPDPERALTALYARHGTVVYSIAAAMCGPERAAEITTDVFVSLRRRPEDFQPEQASLRTYVTGHAHGLAATALRADTHLWSTGEELEGGQRARAEAEALIERAGGTVRRTLRKVPAAARDAVVLTYYGGHTVHELATRFGPSQPPPGQLLRTGLDHVRNGPILSRP